MSAFAAECRAAAPLLRSALTAVRPAPDAVDLDLRPHGAQQQTRRTPLLRLNDGTEGQMDAPPLHTPYFAQYVVSVSNQCCGPRVLVLFLAVAVLVFSSLFCRVSM